MEAKVVLGICTHNRAKSLKRCLNSLCALKYNICVIDNCSIDNTKEVISEFKNVKYILNSNWVFRL